MKDIIIRVSRIFVLFAMMEVILCLVGYPALRSITPRFFVELLIIAILYTRVVFDFSKRYIKTNEGHLFHKCYNILFVIGLLAMFVVKYKYLKQ